MIDFTIAIYPLQWLYVSGDSFPLCLKHPAGLSSFHPKGGGADLTQSARHVCVFLPFRHEQDIHMALHMTSEIEYMVLVQGREPWEPKHGL
jgi:hypothetical protein